MARKSVKFALSTGGVSLKPLTVHHSCGKSPDPKFEPKQRAIIGLYLNLPENELILSVHEKSHIQALDRTRPERPFRPGNPKRHTATYTRYGTMCLLGALCVQEGAVKDRRVDSSNADFLAQPEHDLGQHHSSCGKKGVYGLQSKNW